MKLKITVFCFLLLPLSSIGQHKKEGAIPAPLQVGVSVGIKSITPEKMAYVRSVGISCINISLNPLVDKQGNIDMSDRAVKKLVHEVKRSVKKVGITVSAFHMPFGRYMDLSLIDEAARQKVVAVNEKLLRLCAPLKPAIVLFHPSWYLSLGQRQEHINQLIKSAEALDEPVKKMGATMVIENMTGPKLYVERKGVKYERPLCSTVKEMMEIMSKLPSDIYAAVDMNHILHPEKLVLALGQRLKFIHVSDGDGEHEYHYFPCSGKGDNDWTAILRALYTAGYTGPFMYECHYKDLRDLAPCYNLLYNKFVLEKYIKPEYEK
ncbi:MAG: sugar phosphate isomerase/epimerase [Thermoflavifilum aggregans]|nr:sugar phosphate isomerase/epimerase [Thermoflavifilum aggregans]